MRWLITIFCLLFATGLQAQSYTVTENNCRVYFSNALDREAFWVDQLLWRHVGSNPDQLQIFDGISAITVQDANLVNYPTTDSLITQMEAWIVECDTAGQAPPVPPAPSALFANARSIDFDGTNEQVEVADAVNLSMTDGAGNDLAATWAFWWRTTSGLLASNATFLSKGTTSGVSGNEWILYSPGTGNKLRFVVCDGGDFANRIEYTSDATIESKLADGNWHHIAVVYTGGETVNDFTFYIDGIEEAGTGGVTTYTGMSNTTTDVYINTRVGAAGVQQGKYDQACIFRNVALTLPEIKELMTIRDVTQFTYYDSLVIYQEYDRPDSTQANGIVDLSPAGNNGTMQNGEYADLNECIEWPYPYQLDTSASWANLTPMQSAADTSFGGFAIDYDGSAEYIEVGDNPGLSFTNDSMYVSAWIQLDDATNAPIINKPSEYLFWSNASDQLEVRYIDASTGGYIGRIYSTALTIYEGQYIYVEAILNGNTSADIDLRVNGITVDDTDANSGSYTAMEDQTNDFFISYDGVNYAGGRIGDVVLSGDILTSQYNAHAPVDMTTTGDVLAAYWRGYNSTNVASGVLDQSGNGLNGTPTNTDLADFQYTTPREIFDADTAGSFDFDGATELISISDAADSLVANNLSVFAWVKTTTTAHIGIVAKWPSGSGCTRSWALTTSHLTAGKLGALVTADCSIFNSFSGQRVSSTESINDGQWHLVGFTKEPGANNLLMYVDGLEGTTRHENGTVATVAGNQDAVTIGEYATTLEFPGQIGHVYIYKSTLTPCEVQELYNDGSPIDPRDMTLSSGSGLYNFWKLNQSDDPTGSIIDHINGFNGTMTNGSADDLKTDQYPTN